MTVTLTVIPAEAGIYASLMWPRPSLWTSAFAGVAIKLTKLLSFIFSTHDSSCITFAYLLEF